MQNGRQGLSISDLHYGSRARAAIDFLRGLSILRVGCKASTDARLQNIDGNATNDPPDDGRRTRIAIRFLRTIYVQRVAAVRKTLILLRNRKAELALVRQVPRQRE